MSTGCQLVTAAQHACLDAGKVDGSLEAVSADCAHQLIDDLGIKGPTLFFEGSN